MKEQLRDIIEHCHNIRQLYKTFESEKRIVLYDIEAGELLPMLYADFKSTLIYTKSRQLLAEEYQDAQRHDRILVVVSDSKYQTIKTHTINKNSDQGLHISELTRIF